LEILIERSPLVYGAWHVQDSRGTLEVVDHAGRMPGTAEDQLEEAPAEKRSGIVGRALRHRDQCVGSPSDYSDNCERCKIAEDNGVTLCAVQPIYRDGEILGVLEFFGQDGELSEAWRELLRSSSDLL